jgi:hypothetical protein
MKQGYIKGNTRIGFTGSGNFIELDDAEDKTFDVEQKFIFQQFHADGRSENYEVTESELTQSQKDHLFGMIMNVWNHNTQENRNKFLTYLITATKANINEKQL